MGVLCEESELRFQRKLRIFAAMPSLPSKIFNMISRHFRKSSLSFNLAYIALEDEKNVGLDFLKLSTSLQPANYTFTKSHRPSHLFISFSTRGGESHFS